MRWWLSPLVAACPDCPAHVELLQRSLTLRKASAPSLSFLEKCSGWEPCHRKSVRTPFWTAFASLIVHCEHGSSRIRVGVVLLKRNRSDESVQSCVTFENTDAELLNAIKSTPLALDTLRTVSKSMSALTTGHSIGMSQPRSFQVLDGRAACWR